MTPNPDLSDERMRREPRLDVFKNASGLTFRQRMKMIMPRLLGGKYPGPYTVALYRGRLMGKHFMKATYRAMRTSEHWSKGEVELFAAFTAKQLECRY